MQQTRFTKLIISILAAVFVLAGVLAIAKLYRGDSHLLRNVHFSMQQITPNADRREDALEIQYEISRNAVVSIYFEDESGQRYYFREEKARGVGDYQVLFSGVVSGYRLADEVVEGKIIARLLQNGAYTWTIEAIDENGVRETQSGPLIIAEADTQLPEMRDFTTDRALFTPNRDGINDRIRFQFNLQKDARTRVYLVTADGVEVSVSEVDRDVHTGQIGWHLYDYEGGVDHNALPPEDGFYTVYAFAEDEEGQKMQVETQIELRLGGVPRAEIVSPPEADALEMNLKSVTLCDTLFFTLTIDNVGTAPIRTTGPAPGTVYDSAWNYNTLGWHTESGAWRVAIGYENSVRDYPFRWAIGGREDLEKIGDHYYLMPGERAIVTGGIRITGLLGDRNPQPMWAGLIHEDVSIAQFNNRVDPKSILIDLPDTENTTICEARVVPFNDGP